MFFEKHEAFNQIVWLKTGSIIFFIKNADVLAKSYFSIKHVNMLLRSTLASEFKNPTFL